MARILKVSFVLVLSGSILVCLIFKSRGLLWWSWFQSLSASQRTGKPSWSLNSSQLVSLRNTTLNLFEGVGHSSLIVAFYVWCLRSIFGIISVRNLVSVPAVSVWVGNWALSVVVGYCLEARSILCELRVSVFHNSVWFSFWVLLVCQLIFPDPPSLSFFISLLYSIMARHQGIPRHGSNSGSRGGSQGEGALHLVVFHR